MIYKQRIKPRLIDPSILYKINVAHGWRINVGIKFSTTIEQNQTEFVSSDWNE